MKKINLKGISEILNEKELKNVMGGSGGGCWTIYGNCLFGASCVLPSGNMGRCQLGYSTCNCVV